MSILMVAFVIATKLMNQFQLTLDYQGIVPMMNLNWIPLELGVLKKIVVNGYVRIVI